VPAGVHCLVGGGGRRVVLSASYDLDRYRFVGWRDACTGFSCCTVTMDAAKTVTAVFGLPEYSLRATVVGSGRITSGTWTCRRSCERPFSADEVFEFRAAPKRGWRFVGWTGACRGRGVCSVRFASDAVLRASFRRVRR
jgi:Divergent InlB B-repeat domain